MKHQCVRGESRNVGAMRVQGRDVHRRTSEVVGERGYQKKRGRERTCRDEGEKGMTIEKEDE